MLAHTRRGQGPRATLLLHGFLGSGANLATIAKRLAEVEPERSVYTIDLPGHGRSPALAPDESFTSVAAKVLSVVEGPIEIVGHSLGGRIGLAALGAAPDRVLRLTLLDISPSPTVDSPTHEVAKILLEAPEAPKSREDVITHFVERGLTRGLGEWLAMNLESKGDQLTWRIDRRALVDFHRRTSPTDLWDVAEHAPDKVRAIVGGASPYVSDADLGRFDRLGIRVSILPGAGHFLHVDSPGPLLAELGSRT